MARDATNMPFERPTSYQDNDSPGSGGPENGSKNTFDTSLKMENMLLEEFNYVSVTAYQAMEDRARISNFYYLLLGFLATVLVAIYQFSGSTHSNIPLSLVTILLIVGALISISFFVTLIRLRQAYKESLITMNVIKEFYIDEFKQQMPTIEKAFRWRLKSIPKGERIGSVTFMFAILNVFMGSLFIAGAVFFITEVPLSMTWASIIAVAVFIIAVLVHIYYYHISLSKESDAKTINNEITALDTAFKEGDT